MKKYKLLNELKKDFGTYYSINILNDKNSIFSLLKNTYKSSFEENIFFFHNLLTGKFKNGKASLLINECIDKQKAILYSCNDKVFSSNIIDCLSKKEYFWHQNNDSNFLQFLDERSISVFILDKIERIVSNFIEDNKNNFYYNALESRLLKNIILKTEIGNKLYYLIKIIDNIKNMEISDILALEYKSLLKDNEIIVVSEEHDKIVEKLNKKGELKSINLYFFFSRDNIKEIPFYLHNLEIDIETKSLVYVFGKSDSYMRYKISNFENDYFFDREYEYVYFSREDAINSTKESVMMPN